MAEARERGCRCAPLKTLYCGGGTPALFGAEGFKALRDSGLFALAPGHEWTVELHPAAVAPDLIETLAEIGVTRISLGVQAWDDATLARCNRRHTVQQALDALACARAILPDTGIDLIAGLPGVSAAQWHDTLQRTAALGLPHVSVYALSIEPGSAWHAQGMQEPDPEQLCDAIAEAQDLLEDAGLRRYETSNYALPGHECRHNLNTWRGGDYLGLGRGAVSRLGRSRREGTGKEEVVSPLDDALERALSGLRLAEGWSPETAVQRFPLLRPALPAWQYLLMEAKKHGLLTADNAPTRRGHEVVDALQRELLAAALP